MKLSPNQIKKIESDRKFAWGRVRMYIENTRQKFNYIIGSGFPVGEIRKIKITNEDMGNEYIIQFLRETSWERSLNGYGYVRLIEIENEFYLECIRKH